jgi:DNA invertase Pin-like site-specific DNA recombinase
LKVRLSANGLKPEAKAQGKNISRPKIAKQKIEKILELKAQGFSMNKISKLSGVSYGTVYNYLSDK